MHIKDTQRLVTEIEMLKVVLYLMMCRGNQISHKSAKIIRLRKGLWL
jgi:hypothetical protein